MYFYKIDMTFVHILFIINYFLAYFAKKFILQKILSLALRE